MKHRLRLAMVTAAVAAAAVVSWTLWPRPAPAPPHVTARQYLNVTACLLTGPAGVAPGSPAAAVWSSMETASAQSHVMVSYLPDIAPQSARVLLNSLLQRRCGLIVTSGAPPAMVVAAARANTGQRFMIIADSTDTPAPANATVVSSADAAARVGSTVRGLASAA